jgi:branched-chain amino acid transport system ATP-binding protein
MALLDVQEVSVRFGGLQALSGVTLDVDVGHVTGLIGPNGAGKTTLFNIVTGLLAPNAGRVGLDGRDITRRKPHQRSRLGIGRTFQRLEIFGSLTARENVLVAAEMRQGWSRDRSRTPVAVTEEILDRVGLQDVAEERADKLPTGTGRLIELGRALATQPRVLLLDEPSAGLNESETATLGSLLQEVAGSGLGVLLVEHDMQFVMGTCAHIHVLDFGRIISVGTPKAVQADQTVRSAYLGEAEEGRREAPAAAAQDGRCSDDGRAPALELRDVRARPRRCGWRAARSSRRPATCGCAAVPSPASPPTPSPARGPAPSRRAGASSPTSR